MHRYLACALVVLLACGGPAADLATAPRDLVRDEAMGGHTLARHVGRTEEQLTQRLGRERGISAASTYTDRPTAERVIAETLVQAADRLRDWAARRGPRPNLALRYRSPDGRPIGASLERGDPRPRPCTGALVVLRWDDLRNTFFVLTSYPEAAR